MGSVLWLFLGINFLLFVRIVVLVLLFGVVRIILVIADRILLLAFVLLFGSRLFFQIFV